MKLFFLICFYLLLSNQIINAQTYASIPGPENVLVVYNEQDQTSIDIKDYYQTARGIPDVNIVGLDGLLPQIDITFENVTHRIKLEQSGEIIADSNNCAVEWPTSKHAWIYFNERIVQPIRNRLLTTYVNGQPLKDIIRFIVLCKGVPFKINARKDSWKGEGYNVHIDGLLCFLGETFIDQDALLNYYGNASTYSNPYFNVDPFFTMEKQFLPNYYSTNGKTLSYLISHLDGFNFNDVKNMIDRSLLAINSTDYDWFIDSRQYPNFGGNLFNQALSCTNIFSNLGYENIFFDLSDTNVHYHPKPIITYSSHGIHSPGNDSDYITRQLHLTYAPGCIFNTEESFNGTSLGTLTRRAAQGLIPEFFKMGGTVGVCHAYEPTMIDFQDSIMFSSYALGYSFIEAAYLSLRILRNEGVVVGDPLTRICTPEIVVLSQDTAISNSKIKGKILVPEGKTLTLNGTVKLERNGSLNVSGTLDLSNCDSLIVSGYSSVNAKEITISPNTFVNFSRQSWLKVTDKLILNNDASISFIENSNFLVSGFYCNPGSTINFTSNGNFSVLNTFKAIGTNTHKVTFHFSANKELFYKGKDSILIKYCEFIGPQVNIEYTGNNSHYAALNKIEKSIFKNARIPLTITYENSEAIVNFILKNNEISDYSITGLQLKNVANLHSIGNSINSNNSQSINLKGIHSLWCKNLIIDSSTIINNKTGILLNIKEKVEVASDFIDGSVEIINTVIENIPSMDNYGISADLENITALVLSNNKITNTTYGVNLKNCSDQVEQSVFINDNIFFTNSYGINVVSSHNPIIHSNTFNHCSNGMFFGSSENIQVIDNHLSGNANGNGFGIQLISSSGSLRLNTISNYKIGIQLGNSSPKLALNVITNCSVNGLYVGAGSYPDLSQSFAGNENYPLSGFNNINTNGHAGDGSEIYFDGGNIVLLKGCNTIADDRVTSPPWAINDILIDGYCNEGIDAGGNYWGNHPYYGNNPSGRFGENISIVFEPYLEAPCRCTESSNFLLLRNGIGNVIDTIYSTGIVNNNLTGAAQIYSLANSLFINNHYNEAKQKYYQIVENYGSLNSSVEAYTKLFTISKLQNASVSDFQQLKNYYDSKLELQSDTLMIDIVKHLSNYCLVASEEYVEAINEFDEIVQENPNTDKALFAEIDAYTTALMMDSLTGGLGKTSRYAVNGIDDYNKKINDLVKRKNAGIYKSKLNVIPTEYELFQNYPNPFNPETTIKYAIKEMGLVTLKVYDILGNEVATLVNETKAPGFYKVQFSAGNLASGTRYASGVYFYILKTKNYIKTNKMLLIK